MRVFAQETQEVRALIPVATASVVESSAGRWPGIVIMLFLPPNSRDCAQILAQNFANVRLRQRFEEPNLSGHLVRRKFAPTVCDHLGFGQCRAPSMCHEQPYRLAGFLVRPPHASAFRNTSAGCSDCLDFVWIDVEA